MNPLTAGAVIAGAGAIGSAGVLGAKWLRVAQREHYIAGSVTKIAKLWATKRPINFALAVVLIVLSVAVLILGASGSWSVMALMPALFALFVIAANWPLGLALRGEPKLVLTRRLKTLIAIALCVLAFGYAAAYLTAGPVFSLAVLPLGALISLEAALALASPLERCFAQKFVDSATKKLRRIDPVVIGVTGSWGKTSTKNHIKDLIDGSFAVMATPASWNNRAGLSRAINERLDSGAEIFVAEMGMYKPGEIQDLCTWVKPSICVVTTVGPMHLERAGSLEAIAAAKSEIVANCQTAVLWVEDELVATIVKDAVAADAQIMSVGFSGTENLDIEFVALAPAVGGVEHTATGAVGGASREAADTSTRTEGDYEILFRGEKLAELRLGDGLHCANVGCAIAAAIAAGVSPEVVAKRLDALSQPDNRGQAALSESGVLIFDDTFNANPAGAAKAVERLAASVEGRRVLITPGMVELGPLQFTENENLAALAHEHGVELVTVGLTNRSALLAGHPQAIPVTNRAEAAKWVRENLKKGDAALWENDLPDHYP